MLMTTLQDSPKGQLNVSDLKRLGLNALVFVSPLLVIFFGQLSAGVPFKQASGLLVAGFWILLSDLFKKLQNI